MGTARRVLRLAALSACALATARCDAGDAPPSRLADGSRAVPPAVALEGVDDPAVLTKTNVVPRSSIARLPAAAACLGGTARGEGSLVVRVGAYSTSVTFATSSGRGLVACDGVLGARENGPWCGRAFGRLSRRGLLADPRLDLACTNDEGKPLAFAWIRPGPEAAFVAVEQRGYVEVYETARRLPVRIASTDVDVESSSASFVLSEHDREGRLLRAYRLEPSVAG
jgi:hypothetical protein